MTAKSEISLKEMIGWFRAKAEEFNKIADSLESTFAGGSTMVTPQLAVPPAEITFEQVKAAAQKAKRAGGIADELHTTRERVQAVVQQHKEAFDIIGKGWIKAK